VRLLSGGESEKKKMATRAWHSMSGCDCEGRYVPDTAAAAADAKGGHTGAPAESWTAVAEREAAAAAKHGYAAWLRVRISPSTETEINVQLGELTLKRHHMRMLEKEVAAHHDFVAVFGEASASSRHQCAEVKRSENRLWVRLLGTRHDVQIWSPDERPPRALRAAMLSSAPWVASVLEPLKGSVPILSSDLALIDVKDGHALLSTVDKESGTLKELVLTRSPPAVHVFNVYIYLYIYIHTYI